MTGHVMFDFENTLSFFHLLLLSAAFQGEMIKGGRALRGYFGPPLRPNKSTASTA